MVKPGSDWLTVSEVAEIEGVSTETIRRGIKAGQYVGSRLSDAPRAPWVIDAAAYNRQRKAAELRHWNVRNVPANVIQTEGGRAAKVWLTGHPIGDAAIRCRALIEGAWLHVWRDDGSPQTTHPARAVLFIEWQP